MKTLKETKTVKKSYTFWQLAFFPIGIYKLWKYNPNKTVNLLYSFIYFPVFFLITLFICLSTFAAFLPPLDLTVNDRSDRTLYNPGGNYAVTFITTGAETGGNYELIRVELEPKGGNYWHFHKTFDEEFTNLEGQIDIGLEGEIFHLPEGETILAKKNESHFFHNPSDGKSVLLVKTSPARGLEKTLRVAYGLENDGLSIDGLPKNFWHLVLVMGYSESYFGAVPLFIQEPLVVSLSKLAQWLGHDKELEKYFK